MSTDPLAQNRDFVIDLFIKREHGDRRLTDAALSASMELWLGHPATVKITQQSQHDYYAIHCPTHAQAKRCCEWFGGSVVRSSVRGYTVDLTH
jgi:hypothetical protein